MEGKISSTVNRKWLLILINSHRKSKFHENVAKRWLSAQHSCNTLLDHLYYKTLKYPSNLGNTRLDRVHIVKKKMESSFMLSHLFKVMLLKFWMTKAQVREKWLWFPFISPSFRLTMGITDYKCFIYLDESNKTLLNIAVSLTLAINPSSHFVRWFLPTAKGHTTGIPLVLADHSLKGNMQVHQAYGNGIIFFIMEQKDVYWNYELFW